MKKTSMNTPHYPSTIETALAGIPQFFRSRIIKSYKNVKRAYTEGRNTECVHNSGRFCEVLIRWLQKRLTTKYIPFSEKINNFVSECDKLEQSPKAAGPDGLRILMPRALKFIYSMRNKRDAGHVGGEVDSNPIDAATTVRVVDWCICEVIRVEHGLSLEDAQDLLDVISVRELPQIWNVLGKKRILDPSLSYAQKTLLLIYSDNSNSVPIEDLIEWLEHPRPSEYKSKVISALHNKKFIEYDKELEMVILSPTGAEEVESCLLK